MENNASPISNVSCWSSEGSLIIETSAMEVTDSKASLVEEPSLEEDATDGIMIDVYNAKKGLFKRIKYLIDSENVG